MKTNLSDRPPAGDVFVDFRPKAPLSCVPSDAESSNESGHVQLCPTQKCASSGNRWTKMSVESQQWETQRTLFSSARATRFPPAKVNGVWPLNAASAAGGSPLRDVEV